MATKCGRTVHFRDYDVERLDFGVLADLLIAQAPEWLFLHVEASQAEEAYRLTRFTRAARPGTRIGFAGPFVTAFPEEAIRLGLADVVIRGHAAGALAQLLRGDPPAQVPHVVSATSAGVTLAPGCSGPAFVEDIGADWQLVDESAYRLTIPRIGEVGIVDILTAFPQRAGCDGCAVSTQPQAATLRPVASLLAEAATAGSRVARLRGEDLLVAEDRGAALEQAFSSPGLRWMFRSTPLALSRSRGRLGRLRRAGCVALEVSVPHEDEEVAALPAAADALRHAGLEAVYTVESSAPGPSDHLSHLRRLASALYDDESGRPRVVVQGTFHSPPPDAIAAGHLAGTLMVREARETSPEYMTFVPQSLLRDVPRVDEQRSEDELVEALAGADGRMRQWIEDRFCIPASVVPPSRSLEGIVQDAARLYEAIDGCRTVGQLVDEVSSAPEVLVRQCVAMSLLALTGLVRSRSAAHAVGATARGEFFCSRPWTGFEVGTEDGSVQMCCWAKRPFGNVNTATIADIWNGPTIQEFRRKMAAGEWQDICQPHCPYIGGWMRDDDPLAPQSEAFNRNLERSREDIAARRLVIESLPRYWKVGHSTQCNLDCVMCYQDRHSKQTLPESLYTELPGYYPYMQELMLLGGEPLLIKRIRKLLEEFPHTSCPDAGLAFITNGTVFDERTMSLVGRAKLAWVLISIDAARPDTYARIRVHGVLERTLKGVARWKQLSVEKQFSLVLSYTVMRDNVEEIAEFVDLGRQYEVDCQFMPVLGTKDGQHRIAATALRSEVDRALRRVDAHNAAFPMPMARDSLRALLEDVS